MNVKQVRAWIDAERFAAHVRNRFNAPVEVEVDENCGVTIKCEDPDAVEYILDAFGCA